MRRYLLDSTPLAGYLHGRPHFVQAITPLLSTGEVATSILVYGEVTEYLKGLPDFPLRHAQLHALLCHPFAVLCLALTAHCAPGGQVG